MEYIKSDQFIQIALDNNCDPQRITAYIRDTLSPNYELRSAMRRLTSYRTKGLLPLESGNAVSVGEILKGTTTLYDSQGGIKHQYVKTHTDLTQQLEDVYEAIHDLASDITPYQYSGTIPSPLLEDQLTVYISNDVHLGALCWAPESGEDYDLSLGISRLKASYDYLFQTSPKSKLGLVVDLGDITEADNDKNVTPKSGNVLSVDSRYPKVLRAAYTALIYAIEQALHNHELVYFYNVQGNHDQMTAHSIREIIASYFRNEPRVIVNESPSPIKYHQHGSVLLQFAHGDAMKPTACGEVMAADMEAIFSQTRHRFSHLGHNHKDTVIDGRICRVESHRNLAPLNAWAYGEGYRRNPGTMKSITYSAYDGEISRSIYNVK